MENAENRATAKGVMFERTTTTVKLADVGIVKTAKKPTIVRRAVTRFSRRPLSIAQSPKKKPDAHASLLRVFQGGSIVPERHSRNKAMGFNLHQRVKPNVVDQMDQNVFRFLLNIEFERKTAREISSNDALTLEKATTLFNFLRNHLHLRMNCARRHFRKIVATDFVNVPFKGQVTLHFWRKWLHFLSSSHLLDYKARMLALLLHKPMRTSCEFDRESIVNLRESVAGFFDCDLKKALEISLKFDSMDNFLKLCKALEEECGLSNVSVRDFCENANFYRFTDKDIKGLMATWRKVAEEKAAEAAFHREENQGRSLRLMGTEGKLVEEKRNSKARDNIVLDPKHRNQHASAENLFWSAAGELPHGTLLLAEDRHVSQAPDAMGDLKKQMKIVTNALNKKAVSDEVIQKAKEQLTTTGAGKRWQKLRSIGVVATPFLGIYARLRAKAARRRWRVVGKAVLAGIRIIRRVRKKKRKPSEPEPDSPPIKDKVKRFVIRKSVAIPATIPAISPTTIPTTTTIRKSQKKIRKNPVNRF